ncbi:MAG: hypothetical protein ACOZE5_12470 [Verrucomicrobiota bacterium]
MSLETAFGCLLVGIVVLPLPLLLLARKNDPKKNRFIISVLRAELMLAIAFFYGALIVGLVLAPPTKSAAYIHAGLLASVFGFLFYAWWTILNRYTRDLERKPIQSATDQRP